MASSRNNVSPAATLLVVTDTPEDLDHLQSQLGGEGYRLVQTWDVEAAMAKIEAEPPDLVLLDITTPGLHGLGFCQQLRARPETEALPVIVVAESDSGAAETVADFGADGFICRPFERVELISRVRSLLRMQAMHKRVTEQNRELLDVNVRLDHLNQELRQRNRELELGMDMAHRLQEALLPQRYPHVENIGFAHKYTPAEAVGGDMFQIKGLSDGRAAIVVCDVSGHGVRAALITTIVKAVLDYIDFDDKTPSDVLKDLNSRFRSVLGPLTPQIYVTAFVMFVDGTNRTLTLANAGHPQPLLVSKKRNTAQPIMDSDQSGVAIGFLSDPDYQDCRRELSVGDIVLGFTDGIYEVINDEGELYGLERLRQFIASHTRLIPRDLIQRLISETDDFIAGTPRPDDVCMVTVEVY